MKEIISLLLFLFVLTLKLLSQDKDAEAKAYYINAEEYFNRGSLDSFDSCVIELEKAEKILETTNPKILFLKIKAMQYSRANYNDDYYFYDLVISLKTFFLITDAQNYPNDKYTEIINIQNKLHLKNFRFKSSNDSLGRSKWRQSDSALYFRGKKFLGKQDDFALKCFSKSAQKGYTKAYEAMADYYTSYATDIILRNRNLDKNDSLRMAYRMAIDCYKKLINAGIFYECNYSGDTSKSYLYEIGNLSYYSANYTDALKYLSLAGEKNWNEAFFLLGEIYYNGDGVSVDYKKAFENYLKSATLPTNDKRRAMDRISSIYKDGLGVKKNKELAKECDRKAHE